MTSGRWPLIGTWPNLNLPLARLFRCSAMLEGQSSLIVHPSDLSNSTNHHQHKHRLTKLGLTNQSQIKNTDRSPNKRQSQFKTSPVFAISRFGDEKGEPCNKLAINSNACPIANRQLCTTSSSNKSHDHVQHLLFASNQNKEMGSNVLKIAYGPEIRRVPILTDKITYNELCLLAQRLFRPHLSSSIDNLSLKYVDDGNCSTHS